jgi:hypothetical protein
VVADDNIGGVSSVHSIKFFAQLKRKFESKNFDQAHLFIHCRNEIISVDYSSEEEIIDNFAFLLFNLIFKRFG